MSQKSKKPCLEKSSSASGASKFSQEKCRGNRTIDDLIIEKYTPDDGSQAENFQIIEFFSGNPQVETTRGLLHIYKNETQQPPSDPTLNLDTPLETVEGQDPGPTPQLCMLAVPGVISSHELLQFLAPAADNLEQVRIIRNNEPNQYMVILKFREQEMADEFYRSFNGVHFNSIEPGICHLVYVERIETFRESEGGSHPLEGHTELPTCACCLERMDESVKGILTILCNHSFHGECISKWIATKPDCPVCRFSQTPELTPEQCCSICGKQSDLWICLICGNVGCGRYGPAHGLQHFKDTSHTFCMQIGTNRVWDYAGDNYVHRLIQTDKGDLTSGKMVEHEPGSRADEDQQMDHDAKTEAITLEYTYLLTNQLESQRIYFEEKLGSLQKAYQIQVEELQSKISLLTASQQDLTATNNSLNTYKTQLEKRVRQQTAKIQEQEKKLAEAETMSSCLTSDQPKWAEIVRDLKERLEKSEREKDEKIRDLEDQLRDIMIHLEASEKLAQDENQDELQGSTVSVPDPPVGQTTKRRGKKK